MTIKAWDTPQRGGVTIRCYDEGCEWVGDSAKAAVLPSGEERCPVCLGSTIPPLKFRRQGQ